MLTFTLLFDCKYGILWFCALIIIIPSMAVVYLHVRKQESKAASWAKKSGQQESYEHSKKVMQQGLFFAFAFIITWIFPTLTRLMQAITGSSPFWLIQLMTIFLPMQVSLCMHQSRYLRVSLKSHLIFHTGTNKCNGISTAQVCQVS
jgi:hypothetical protein